MFTSPSQLKLINDWEKVNENVEIIVAVDIGGSGLRIRISNLHNETQFLDLGHVRAQTTEETITVFQNLGQSLKEVIPAFVSKAGALAVAGPISNGKVVLTNWIGPPADRTLVLDELPEVIFPKGKTLFLNDLEAGAYGIIAAQHLGELASHFTQLWSFGPNSQPQPLIANRTAVLAMGSGLGAAIILHTPLIPDPIVMPTELGHIQISVACDHDPNHQIEHDLIQHVSNHYHAGKQAPEYEDIASGRGLSLTYQYFMIKRQGKKIPVENINAGDVAKSAKEGDPVAREALKWHYLIFMRAAKTIATSLSCETILLALDNQVKNAWFVQAIADELKDEFNNFIRPDLVKGIRVYAQTETLNFNILGTTYMAKQLCK